MFFLLLIYKFETGAGSESEANKVLISEITAYCSNEPIKERICPNVKPETF